VLEKISTFGINTTVVETRDFASLASTLAERSDRSVFFCNVHMLMLAQEDAALAKAMADADVIFADGVPVAWLQGRISGKDAVVIRGYEMMLAICKRAAIQGEKVGFLGSTQDVMDGLVSELSKRFGGLSVVYQYCPPFTQGQLSSSEAELSVLKTSGVKWLFVGLGCPKQEKWTAKYTHDLDCNVLAVGAAFDWLSGKVSKPPAWMEKYSLAWFYRFINNPSKTWSRYLIYNTKFILKASRVLLGGE
jgi:N-acetylglucosaminyldiphosphoundecaprenol N-acetyl-beta-D-mannosaminyltransferase